MVGPAAKREAVAHLQAVMDLSERRACLIVGADRKMIRYRSRRPEEAELRGRLRELANERRRFGYQGAGPFVQGGPNPNLRVLFSTVLEKLTVILAPDSRIDTFEDLLGRSVDFGPPASGSRASAVRYLESRNLSLEDFTLVGSGPSSLAARSLCRGDADAFVFVSAHPNGVVQEAIADCGATLFPGGTEYLAPFVEQFPEYRRVQIEADFYPGIAVDVDTFGVPAIVVADARLGEEQAYRLTKTVFEQLNALRVLHLSFEDLTVEDSLRSCAGAPYHRGALRYFAEAGITPSVCQ
jgi:TRAP transporter TAXI family solute receptor